MATHESALIDHDTATTAAYRAWGAALSAALDAVDFDKTADTGQIDWATVNMPASGASGGYEIRAFTDPLQATKPIVCRLDFYRSSSATDAVFGVRLTVATGSNGAGTLTPPTNVVHNTSSRAWLAAADPGVDDPNRRIIASSRMDADGAYVTFGYGANFTEDLVGDIALFGVQRTVDGNGDPTGDGCFMFASSADSDSDACDENYYDFGGGVLRGSHALNNRPTTAGRGAVTDVPYLTVGMSGGDVYLCPWIPVGTYRIENPLPDWLVYHEAAAPRAGGTVTLSRFGASRTYRLTGAKVRTFSTGSSENFDWRLAVLWE